MSTMAAMILTHQSHGENHPLNIEGTLKKHTLCESEEQ